MHGDLDDIGGRAAKDVKSMEIVQNAQDIAGFNSRSVSASLNSSLHHRLETPLVPDCVRSQLVNCLIQPLVLAQALRNELSMFRPNELDTSEICDMSVWAQSIG